VGKHFKARVGIDEWDGWRLNLEEKEKVRTGGIISIREN
jgi:hypothetical protein